MHWDASCSLLWLLSEARGSLVYASCLVISCMYSLRVGASRPALALTTQTSCPLHQPGWTLLSCGKDKHRVKSLNLSSVKGIFSTGLCFIGLTLFHVLYKFQAFDSRIDSFIQCNFRAYHCLEGWCQEDGSRLISAVSSNRTRGTRHKLKHRTFHLSMRGGKKAFTLRMTKHWNS